jgi:HEAT repeat protein
MILAIRFFCSLLLCLATLGVASAGQGTQFDKLLRVAENTQADGQQRMEAIHALGELGDPRGVKPLIRILERDMGERTGLWAAAIPALGMLGDPAASKALIAALNKRDDDWLGREMAAAALGRIGDTSAVPALIHAAWMADTRESAIAALAHIASPASVPSLIEALDEGESDEIQELAMEGLGRIGRPAVKALIQAASEAYPEAPMTHKRVAICRLLRKIGGGQANNALRQLATDADPLVKACASGTEPLINSQPKHD